MALSALPHPLSSPKGGRRPSFRVSSAPRPLSGSSQPAPAAPTCLVRRCPAAAPQRALQGRRWGAPCALEMKRGMGSSRQQQFRGSGHGGSVCVCPGWKSLTNPLSRGMKPFWTCRSSKVEFIAVWGMHDLPPTLPWTPRINWTWSGRILAREDFPKCLFAGGPGGSYPAGGAVSGGDLPRGRGETGCLQTSAPTQGSRC